MGQMAADVFSQSFYGEKLNVGYLDRPRRRGTISQTSSARGPTSESHCGVVCSDDSCNTALYGRSGARVLRIRNEESEAFDSYRAALGKILSEYVAPEKEFTEGEARELYLDTLEPQLMQLQQQAQTSKGADQEIGADCGDNDCRGSFWGAHRPPAKPARTDREGCRRIESFNGRSGDESPRFERIRQKFAIATCNFSSSSANNSAPNAKKKRKSPAVRRSRVPFSPRAPGHSP